MMISTPRHVLTSINSERIADGAHAFANLRVGIATLLTMLPVTLIVPALIETVALPLGASSFWTHAFMSVNMIGAIVATPFIGRLCDRADPRLQVIVAALLLDGLLLGGMSIASSVGVLLGLRFVEGMAHMLALAGLMAAAADSAAEGRRGRTMGVIGACMMLGTALGTRLGGVVWRVWPGAVFEAAGCAALLAAGFAWIATPRLGAGQTPPARFTSWTLALADRRLLLPLCLHVRRSVLRGRCDQQLRAVSS